MVIKTKQVLTGLLLLCILLAGGIFLYLHLRPTEENRIRKLCNTFTEGISKKGKEGAIPAAARAKSLSNLFTEQSYFSIAGLPWASAPRSREKLSADIFRSRAMFSRLHLSFEDLSIRIEEGKNKANITLSAVLTGTVNTDKELREVRELEGSLVKEEGVWLFESFRIRKMIRK